MPRSENWTTDYQNWPGDNYWEFLDYMEWTIHRDGQVATLKYEIVDKPIDRHIEVHGLWHPLEEARWDDSIRVIVIAGRDDGSGIFSYGPRRRLKEGEAAPPQTVRTTEPTRDRIGWTGVTTNQPYSHQQGVERTFQTLALMEKPVIYKWVGDVWAFAGAAMFGCDIIIAEETATFCDAHLANRQFDGSTGPLFCGGGVTAGDGSLAFMPLYMSPAKIKEFLLMGEYWTAKQFEDLGAINYALPLEQVDSKVDEFVEKFLRRHTAPVARTKRGLNKRMLQNMNLMFDYAYMAEIVDIYQGDLNGNRANLTLNPAAPLYNSQWGGELVPNAEDLREEQYGATNATGS